VRCGSNKESIAQLHAAGHGLLATPPALQVLVATAVRLMHAASQAAQDSASGVATPNSTRAYNLLRQAAGMLEYAVREVLPSLPAGAAADLDPQVRPPNALIEQSLLHARLCALLD